MTHKKTYFKWTERLSKAYFKIKDVDVKKHC